MDFNAIARDTMRDASITLLHASRASLAALLVAAACALGGCASNGAATSSASGAFAMASASDGPTVAFEQIDAPPAPAPAKRGPAVANAEELTPAASSVAALGYTDR